MIRLRCVTTGLQLAGAEESNFIGLNQKAGHRSSVMTHDNRSKTTVCANKFGLAVLLASVHASEQRASATFVSAIVHHSLSVRAGSGSVKPRRSSICPNVRTTLFVYLFSKYLVEQPVISPPCWTVRLRVGRVCFGLLGLPRRALVHPLQYFHST